MAATQSDMVQIMLTTMAVIFCSYATGRAHQWYRQDVERDVAFREGYNQASRTLFPLATRQMAAEVGDRKQSRSPAKGFRAAPDDEDGLVRTRIIQLDHERRTRPC